MMKTMLCATLVAALFAVGCSNAAIRGEKVNASLWGDDAVQGVALMEQGQVHDKAMDKGVSASTQTEGMSAQVGGQWYNEYGYGGGYYGSDAAARFYNQLEIPQGVPNYAPLQPQDPLSSDPQAPVPRVTQGFTEEQIQFLIDSALRAKLVTMEELQRDQEKALIRILRWHARQKGGE